MNVDEIDIAKLKRDLEDYYLSAMFMVSDFAMIDVEEVQTASPEKIIKMAEKNGFDLNKYKR